jgi:hypothetical protein
MRVLGRNVRANHHPFTGRGASLYVGIGPSNGSDPGPESVVFRKLRVLGGSIVKGSGWSIADGINKTCRISHVSDPTSVFSYEFPAGWHGRIVYLQIRTHWDDCETVINPDPVRLDFTSGGDLDPTIHGTGTIISAEKRDGGVYRIRTRYTRALDGTQPLILLLRKSAGTGTLADVELDYSADKTDYKFDTAALTDAGSYTFQFVAQNDTIELVLDSITFTADAAGPPAVTGLTLALT